MENDLIRKTAIEFAKYCISSIDLKVADATLQNDFDKFITKQKLDKPVVMQTLPFSFVEWYSGMQKEKIESAYKRWMKEGNVAVGQRSVDTVAEAWDDVVIKLKYTSAYKLTISKIDKIEPSGASGEGQP